MVKGRLRKLRARLRQEKCDAALITGVSDVRYLSGFSGDDSWVVIGLADKPVLVTDSRYTEQAKSEAPLYRIVQRKTPLSARSAAIFTKMKASRIAFDPGQLTVSSFDAVSKELKRAGLVPISGLVKKLRQIKDASEIKIIRRATRIAEKAFLKVKAKLRPGMTEKQIANLIEMYLREAGAEKSSFDTITAVRERASLAHARATNRVLTERDPLLVDWGALHRLYCSDLTRVILPDRIRPKLREVYQIVLEAQNRAIRKIRPGVSLRAVDATARDYIAKSGYGKYFGHGLGHGVGLDIHELPILGATAEGILKPGMVFSVEPGIYLPGQLGVRIEDLVLVTSTGCELLSHLEKKLV